MAAVGVKAVTVHGRSRSQYYGGTADWDFYPPGEEKARRFRWIGNGDVFSGADAVRLREETGCDGVMLGRGIFSYPWLIREAVACLAGETPPAPPDTGEKVAMALRQS